MFIKLVIFLHLYQKYYFLLICSVVRMSKISDKSDKFLLHYSNIFRGFYWDTVYKNGKQVSQIKNEHKVIIVEWCSCYWRNLYACVNYRCKLRACWRPTNDPNSHRVFGNELRYKQFRTRNTSECVQSSRREWNISQRTKVPCLSTVRSVYFLIYTHTPPNMHMAYRLYSSCSVSVAFFDHGVWETPATAVLTRVCGLLPILPTPSTPSAPRTRQTFPHFFFYKLILNSTNQPT